MIGLSLLMSNSGDVLSAAILPGAEGATLGRLPKGEAWDKAAAEAARTIPGRENGGNCDIKNLSRGCKVYFPGAASCVPDAAELRTSIMRELHCSPYAGHIGMNRTLVLISRFFYWPDMRTDMSDYVRAVFVEGANLSVGDLHFSQGDGEISFCGAIEMSGWLDFKWVLLFVHATPSCP